jgi:hypothetical protein
MHLRQTACSDLVCTCHQQVVLESSLALGAFPATEQSQSPSKTQCIHSCFIIHSYTSALCYVPQSVFLCLKLGIYSRSTGH